MSAAQSAATNALLAIAAMLIVPQFTLVHPYLHLLIVAPLLVFAGCQRAALEAAKGAASQMETVSKKDAMQFPLIGSAVLFGLYAVIEFVKKEYLDMLLNVYFALLGSLSIHACVCPPLTKALGMEGLHRCTSRCTGSAGKPGMPRTLTRSRSASRGSMSGSTCPVRPPRSRTL